MPTYDYECQKCRKVFSVVHSMTDHSKAHVTCPKCKSKEVRQLLAPVAAQTSRKS